jgi:hypothetical protein
VNFLKHFKVLPNPLGHTLKWVTRHPNLPGYPGPADIKFYGLIKQDMYWEKEINADFEWK